MQDTTRSGPDNPGILLVIIISLAVYTWEGLHQIQRMIDYVTGTPTQKE
ncbi:MAG: hypothetical protein Q8O53_03150 [Candidatus Moranbacteria bacterium]|nr:hypothetical protein [Candidatus Moranbacteria bacterium]